MNDKEMNWRIYELWMMNGWLGDELKNEEWWMDDKGMNWWMYEWWMVDVWQGDELMNDEW